MAIANGSKWSRVSRKRLALLLARCAGLALLTMVVSGCERQNAMPATDPSARATERVPSSSERPRLDPETKRSPEQRDRQSATSPETQAYENKRYGFRLLVPVDWELAAEPKRRFPHGQSEGVVFALPPVWSELENSEIRNAIAVKAIWQIVSISAEDFATTHALLDSEGRLSREVIEDFRRPAYVETVKWNGLIYKRRLEFEMQNMVGYVLEFVATPGTYEQNYPKFRKFADAVEFFPLRGDTPSKVP